MSLSGTRAVIVGGTSGIGLAAAQAFADAGASVVVASRSAEKLAASAGLLGASAAAHTLDALDEPRVKWFFEAVGSFDHLVISLAGGAAMGPFAKLTDAGMRTTFEVKLWAYLNVIRNAIPYLNGHGSIAVVTGASALRASPGASALGAANGAMEAIVPTLAVELAPIRVNAVSPGIIETPAWERVPPDIRAVIFNENAAKTPVGRVGHSSEVAAAIVALAGNGFITGVILPCDGGGSL